MNNDWIDRVILGCCEIPDRFSPNYLSEAMVVTPAELRALIEIHMPPVADPATNPQVEREWRVLNSHGKTRHQWKLSDGLRLQYSIDGGKTWVDAETGS